jgi:hypothetical protein
MAKTKTASKRRDPDMEGLPEGFEPLRAGRVEGFFIREEDNQVQGILKDSFVVKGKFGSKTVYKILITSGETRIMTKDDAEQDATEGMLIGLDESGWLKSLADVEKGREVFVKCMGLEEPTKEFPRGQWKFKLGVMPVAKSDDDNIPF